MWLFIGTRARFIKWVKLSQFLFKCMSITKGLLWVPGDQTNQKLHVWLGSIHLLLAVMECKLSALAPKFLSVYVGEQNEGHSPFYWEFPQIFTRAFVGLVVKRSPRLFYLLSIHSWSNTNTRCTTPTHTCGRTFIPSQNKILHLLLKPIEEIEFTNVRVSNFRGSYFSSYFSPRSLESNLYLLSQFGAL